MSDFMYGFIILYTYSLCFLKGYEMGSLSMVYIHSGYLKDSTVMNLMFDGYFFSESTDNDVFAAFTTFYGYL